MKQLCKGSEESNKIPVSDIGCFDKHHVAVKESTRIEHVQPLDGANAK